MTTRIPKAFYETVCAYVTIKVNPELVPEDWLSRWQTPEFQTNLYVFADEDAVIKHFAYNCVVNGVEDISRLDGWADLPKGAVMVMIEDVE